MVLKANLSKIADFELKFARLSSDTRPEIISRTGGQLAGNASLGTIFYPGIETQPIVIRIQVQAIN